MRQSSHMLDALAKGRTLDPIADIGREAAGGADGRSGRSQLFGYTQALGRHLMPSISRDLVCCCITGARAPGVRQLT